MGFKALATTSAGCAWSLGHADNRLTLSQALEHLRVIVGAVKVPVNADFVGGFAVDPDHVAENVKLAAATGIAGLSIEDSTGDEANHLHDFDLAVERVRAARQAIDETIRRLCAYSEAGADCLYAPRIDRIEHVAAVIAAVSPKPVNLLINAPFLTVAEAATLGVRRISVGGTLARTAWAGFLQAAGEIADSGTFSRFQRPPNVDALFDGR